ncbi:unnamed protein product [Fraxinus pennsylvanica]|uniref:Uncharacterized protein n=1 Tax=Fraxinus pennsylvanica TaxID=56036 RepID=A0AAD2A4R4_9LAMI|nr:unnamed protein product [Fraxinus pennsylvanica]
MLFHVVMPSDKSSQLTRLEGKVELITSAASGISESTARLFSIQVFIADIQDDSGEEVFKDLGQSPASFVHCDVTKESDVEATVNKAVARYGKLDMMYNNAGISGIQKKSILDNEKIEFKKIVSVNMLNMTANVCSTIETGASDAYASSKHGVVGLTRNIAMELGEYGIHVNCESPHLVATPLSKDFFKLNNEDCHSVYSHLKCVLPKSEDVAEAALFLASDESKYVSGHNLFVDGSFTSMNSVFSIFGNPHTGVSKT